MTDRINSQESVAELLKLPRAATRRAWQMSEMQVSAHAAELTDDHPGLQPITITEARTRLNQIDEIAQLASINKGGLLTANVRRHGNAHEHEEKNVDVDYVGREGWVALSIRPLAQKHQQSEAIDEREASEDKE